ncbi:hypothetical protein ACP6JD_004997 [Aspergillus fumigatus]
MAPPQKPETFMLSNEAQQSLPHDAQVALQQVDNCGFGRLISGRNNLFHISGTDIVRCLAFRFQAFGRPVKNSKKFEEGIFSDLRNLKAGTDATLEEPKSPFLDFLYKNNCIRTQKKQKVFYWYSVPHDRLFLDALERDLKREKMGQEATTLAVSEPALSFEFDSSQSLYEQLTKAQQANSSSFHAGTTFGQSNSPIVRTVDAMPPPQMAPPAMTVLQDDAGNQAMYSTMPMAHPLTQAIIKREPDYGQIQYDRNGIPIRIHQRHASMPSFVVEYSPAPSFVSSQYEDYSNRGLSFEPVTPPQHSVPLGPEPAYIANEDTGLYTAIPDITSAATFNPMMQLPPSNLASASYPMPARTYHSNVYSVIEGSPTYKQRRRRSSIPPSAAANGHAQTTSAPSQQIAYAAHRPSDLRRSVSNSVVPAAEGEDTHEASNHGANGYTSAVLPQRNLLHDMSRNGTPLSNVEENPESNPQTTGHQDDLVTLPNGEAYEGGVQNNVSNKVERFTPGPIRRARSATMMELGPYPQKSHSCPIPSCGRLFKRLEHLKRHRRIHEAQQDGQQPLPTHDEDLENEENELGSDRESSPGEAIPSSMANVMGLTSMPSTMPLTSSMPSMMAPQMIAPQLLQQQI